MNININSQLAELRGTAEGQLNTFVTLSGVPSDFNIRSILDRIPRDADSRAPGMDAAVAFCLDLFPKEHASEIAELIGKLHIGDYSGGLISKMEKGVSDLRAAVVENAVLYWALGSYVCEDDRRATTGARFIEQYNRLKDIMQMSLSDRRDIAKDYIEKEVLATGAKDPDGHTFVSGGGNLIGAYLQGNAYAYYTCDSTSLYFIGTHHESLGLDNFAWGTRTEEVNGEQKSRSGFISKSFVKCDGIGEAAQALHLVKNHFNGMR